MPVPITIKVGATPNPNVNKAKPIVMQITEDHTAADVLQRVLENNYKNVRQSGRYVIFAGKPGQPPKVTNSCQRMLYSPHLFR